MRRKDREVGTAAFALVLCAAGGAFAQMPERGGWHVEVPNTVSPSNPSVYVQVTAWFDHVVGAAELFARADLELHASELGFVEPFARFNTRIGMHSQLNLIWEGTQVRGIGLAQLHFPPNFRGDPSNPIWAFDILWGTSVFTPRRITIDTKSLEFDVYDSWLTRPNRRPVTTRVEGRAFIDVRPDCYADCDSSTGRDVLDIFDFLCFQNLYTGAEPYACDCDTTTGPGLCDIFDFLCFQNAFAAGCP